MKHVICSHGFGVRADSRGMFTDIVAGLPEYDFVMFDYNDERPNGDTYVRSLPDMVAVLQKQIDAANGEVELLCHSLGCVVAGLADLSRVSEIILLAPPVRISQGRFVEMLSKRKGSKIDPSGMSMLPRTDGSTTYLSKEFFASVENINPMELYRKIANKKRTVIIRALRDEMVGLTNVVEIENADHIELDTDHNFTGANRQKLIDTLSVVL